MEKSLRDYMSGNYYECHYSPPQCNAPASGRSAQCVISAVAFSSRQNETRIFSAQNASLIEIVGDHSRIRTCNPRSANPVLAQHRRSARRRDEERRKFGNGAVSYDMAVPFCVRP
jgi:hypothetical protein